MNYYGKHLNLILLLIFTASIVIVSCNQNNDSNMVLYDTADQTTVSGIYRLDTLILPDGYKISSYIPGVKNVITHGNRIYAVCKKTRLYFTDGQRRFSINSIIYFVDLEGKNEKIFPLDGMDGIQINSFDMDSAGNFYIIADISILYKFNPDGSLISCIEISEPGSERAYIKVGDDKLYVYATTWLKVLNFDLVFLYDMQIDRMNLIFEFTPDGKMMAENINTGYNALPQYYYINETEKRLEQAEILRAPENVTKEKNSYFVKFGEGYDIYYYNTYGIYGYNEGDENADMLCDWVNSGLYFDYTELISVISPDKMVCIFRDMFAETDIITETVYDLVIMTLDEDAVPKITITLAYADKIDEVLLAAINFNRLNDKYRIVFKDYTIYNFPEDMSAGQNKFNMDLISGVIPDIMLLSMNLPYSDYIDKGLFVDFYSLFDNDSEMSRDDILYAVRASYETNGKLYCLPTNFIIETLTGKAILVGEKESLTLDEFYMLYEKADNEARFCNIVNNKYFLKSMLRANLCDFIDYENLTCSFDSDKFTGYIDFMKNLPVKTIDSNNAFISYVSYTDFMEIRDNKLYLCKNNISGPDSYIPLKYIYGNDKFVIKGFPTDNTSGSMIISSYTFGISNRSECKNGAFEFIKYYLSDKIQTSDELLNSLNGTLNGRLPVTVSALDILLGKAADTYFYLKEDNSLETKNLNMIKEYGTYNPELDTFYIKEGFTLYRFTEEDVKWYRDYLTEGKIKNNFDTKINEIIWEELDLYFNGAVTALEAAKFIQNRVSIYINERYS